MPEVPLERKMFVDTIRKFARNELELVADEIDATGEFPVNLYRRLGALGFLGLRLPAEYGGFMEGNPDSVTVMMCVEEIA
ncbi:MAG TPA: acyl-CoA dehydrogenase family protein, partial [bacterium]|nr:acyl-CoA dehydrogenase family protein [bacterium]